MPPQVASGRYCLERWFNYEIFAAPRRRWALAPGGARGALCACSGSRDSVIIERKENATPSHKSIQEEKITDLIDLLLSKNVKNKVEVQKAPEYSVSYLCVITSNFDPSPSLCSIAGQSYDRKCDYHNWGHDQETLFLRGSLGVVFFFCGCHFSLTFWC